MTDAETEIIKAAESIYPCVGCAVFSMFSNKYIRNPRNCNMWLNQRNECPSDAEATSSALLYRNNSISHLLNPEKGDV